MRPLKLLARFIQVSFQEEAAYRANFTIRLFSSVLNLITGILGILIIFEQVQSIHGWDLPATLALLGVFLTVAALRSLFIGPGLEALAGPDGEVWSGVFDFTLLRPLDTQFLVSVRKWRVFALFDLLLGLGVIGAAVARMPEALTSLQVGTFLLSLMAGLLILYSFLLIFAALIFWSPGVLFTWVFDGLFELARFPLGVYPGWVRMLLTWVVPVGVITTFPAQALVGAISLPALLTALLLAGLLTLGASVLFRYGLRRYAGASS